MKNLLLLLCFMMPIMAFADDDKSLLEWAEEQREPEMIDGVKIFRPAVGNGKMTFGDYVQFRALTSNNDAFTRALVFAILNLDSETEEIEAVDYDAHRFVVKRTMASENNIVTYCFSEAFQVSDGVISFMIPEIIAKFRDKLFINRRLSFAKLEPNKKETHQTLLNDFSLLNSQYIHRMAEEVQSSNIERVRDWNVIKKGKATKGMNSTEVLITEGRPDNITETKTATKWMYGSSMIVIFIKGQVDRIVNF